MERLKGANCDGDVDWKAFAPAITAHCTHSAVEAPEGCQLRRPLRIQPLITHAHFKNSATQWKTLKGACANCDGDVDWNFRAKFLVDKNGAVVTRR